MCTVFAQTKTYTTDKKAKVVEKEPVEINLKLKKKVTWAEDVVDNEHHNKFKSKSRLLISLLHL